MAEEKKITPFEDIYDLFFNSITDDMYISWNRNDTEKDIQGLLVRGLNFFEFPRFDIFDFELGKLEEIPIKKDENDEEEPLVEYKWTGGFFNSELTVEEKNILSLCMVIEWLGRQIATTDLTREQYTGSDFKMSSQANHMAKLKNLMEKWQEKCFHLQRLYKRRKRENGQIKSTLGQIMEVL